jgi:hypothetical protein
MTKASDIARIASAIAPCFGNYERHKGLIWKIAKVYLEAYLAGKEPDPLSIPGTHDADVNVIAIPHIARQAFLTRPVDFPKTEVLNPSQILN